MLRRVSDGDLPVGTNVITNLSYQRRTPINVVVSLDDPEANSFIRDGSTDKLSKTCRKEKETRTTTEIK